MKTWFIIFRIDETALFLCRVKTVSKYLFHTCCSYYAPLYFLPEQDNLWKYALNNRISQAAIRAFDMVFIIGQKSYDGYEYYDFFEQVFERLKGDPFRSNLTSEKEVVTHYAKGKYVETNMLQCNLK